MNGHHQQHNAMELPYPIYNETHHNIYDDLSIVRYLHVATVETCIRYEDDIILLSKGEAELRLRVIKTISPEWTGFNWLLSQCNNYVTDFL